MKLDKKIMLRINNEKVFEYIEKKQKLMTEAQNQDKNINYKIKKMPYSKVIEKIILEVIDNE